MKKFVVIFFLVMLFMAVTLVVGCTEARLVRFEHDTYTVNSERVFIPTVKIAPKTASYEIISSNNTIAVAVGGEVTTVKEGVVTLTAVAGEQRAECTLYVKDDKEYGGDDVVLAERITVSLSLVNYELAGLSTGVLPPVQTIKNSYLNVNEPFINGYRVEGWYLDRACTVFFDINNDRVTENITLYAQLVARENSFTIVNGYVTGVTYANLPHETLEFPEYDIGGAEVIGIADKAFYGDEGIVTVTLPAGYKTIGDAAFAGCKNLTTVNLAEGSELEVIGTDAFGTTLDENDEFLTACESLTTIRLPDTVRRIGAYAFYGGKSFSIDRLPNALKKLEQYVFAGTNMGDISLKNITELLEGAFYNCKKLAAVSDVEGIVFCDKLVFYGTALLSSEQMKYTKTGKDADALFYAETILIGCRPNYGRMLGSGKVYITEETTLIACGAFSDSSLGEITVYLDTANARAALLAEERRFIGRDAFLNVAGVAIVVGEGEYSAYRTKYTVTAEDASYAFRARFCTQTSITVAGTASTLNAGTHTLLRFLDTSDAIYYHYEKYSFDKETMEGGAKEISLNTLLTENKITERIRRINSLAFSQVSNLIWLELSDTDSIAYLGISQCTALKVIRLNLSRSIVALESTNSIQFSTLHDDCRIYVKNADFQTYYKNWSDRVTARDKLQAS